MEKKVTICIFVQKNEKKKNLTIVYSQEVYCQFLENKYNSKNFWEKFKIEQKCTCIIAMQANSCSSIEDLIWTKLNLILKAECRAVFSLQLLLISLTLPSSCDGIEFILILNLFWFLTIGRIFFCSQMWEYVSTKLTSKNANIFFIVFS